MSTLAPSFLIGSSSYLHIREKSPCKTDPPQTCTYIVKMRFEGVKKKINNACYYVIQKSLMLSFLNIDSIDLYF